MANLQKVVKLTQAQYNTLASGGTVGEYTGLSDNYLYLVRDTSDALSAYPVGSIYMSMNSTSPAELFGGNWTRIEGRFLVGQIPDDANEQDMDDIGYAKHTSSGHFGIGSSTSLAVNMSLVGDQVYGITSHPLSVNEMPSHKHIAYLGTTSSSGSVYWGTTNFSWTGSQPYAWPDTVVLGATGGGEKHNNMPPFTIVYMWRRTS